MTREIGINMRGYEVRAILDGRKTQTRRICLEDVPHQPSDTIHAAHLGGPLQDGVYLDAYCDHPKTPDNPRGAGPFWCWWTRDNRCGAQFKPTRWIPGDHLWVRERFSGEWPYNNIPPRKWDRGGPIWYWADGNPDDGDWTKPKPSLHMPRWASRITLLVTDVRVERLQDISEADAIAEGVTAPAWGARDAFRGLWDSLYAKRGHGWDANPWVSVTTFERVK